MTIDGHRLSAAGYTLKTYLQGAEARTLELRSVAEPGRLVLSAHAEFTEDPLRVCAPVTVNPGEWASVVSSGLSFVRHSSVWAQAVVQRRSVELHYQRANLEVTGYLPATDAVAIVGALDEMFALGQEADPAKAVFLVTDEAKAALRAPSEDQYLWEKSPLRLCDRERTRGNTSRVGAITAPECGEVVDASQSEVIVRGSVQSDRVSRIQVRRGPWASILAVPTSGREFTAVVPVVLGINVVRVSFDVPDRLREGSYLSGDSQVVVVVRGDAQDGAARIEGPPAGAEQ